MLSLLLVFRCLFPVWIPWDSCSRPVDLTGRPMCCPGLKGACAYATFIAGFSLFGPRLDSVGQLLSAHETYITSAHYSYNSAPPTTRSDGFLWTTTSSCCCNARSSSSSNSSNSNSNSSSTCCCNTLYRANITPVQAVFFWPRLAMLQQQQSSSPVRHRHT